MGDTWKSITKKFKINKECGYLTVVLEDDKPIRILLDVSRQGSTLSGFARQWAQTFSIAIEAGVPIERLIEDSIGVNFEPAAWTDMGFSRSIVDYVARYLQSRFLTEGDNEL